MCSLECVVHKVSVENMQFDTASNSNTFAASSDTGYSGLAPLSVQSSKCQDNSETPGRVDIPLVFVKLECVVHKVSVENMQFDTASNSNTFAASSDTGYSGLAPLSVQSSKCQDNSVVPVCSKIHAGVPITSMDKLDVLPVRDPNPNQLDTSRETPGRVDIPLVFVNNAVSCSGIFSESWEHLCLDTPSSPIQPSAYGFQTCHDMPSSPIQPSAYEFQTCHEMPSSPIQPSAYGFQTCHDVPVASIYTHPCLSSMAWGFSSELTVQPLGVVYAKIYDYVWRSKRPNYLQVRIPLPSFMNIPLWRQLLCNYHDNIIWINNTCVHWNVLFTKLASKICSLTLLVTQIHLQPRAIQDIQACEYLQFGFPIGYDSMHMPSPTHNNHPSAVDYESDIDHYIQTEIQHGAMIGPFMDPPFQPTHVSPLMTVQKGDKSAGKRRCVVDMSWPPGQSVNDNIPDGVYLKHPYTLSLPHVDMFAEMILAHV